MELWTKIFTEFQISGKLTLCAKNVKKNLTELKNIALPCGWIRRVVNTEVLGHIVAVEPFSKI